MTQRKSRDEPDGRIEDLSANLGLYISNLFNVLDKRMALEVTPQGLTNIEYSLLWHCLEEESTATRLAQILPVDAARISRIVTGLVEKGLLRRRRLRNDRRVVMLRVTEEGRELTSRIYEVMQRYYAMLSEDIDEEEAQVFASVITKILAKHVASLGSG